MPLPLVLSPWAGSLLAKMVDPTILLSFDRTGYWIHSATFQASDIDVDLSGRICLVTGANSGIGFATAQALAQRNADVWLLCRNRERGHAAVATIQQELPGSRVYCEVLDVSCLASVRSFCQRFTPQHVDVLVHNAGVLPNVRSETEEGVELTWATNVIGPFLLTQLLLPKLKTAGKAPVITVSSGGMYPTRLKLDDVESHLGKFNGVAAYSLTKRAEVVLNELWAERYAEITFAAMHPGWVDTPALESSLPYFHQWLRKRLRTPAEGADTIVWLATCPQLLGISGRFWFDRKPRRTHFFPWTRESTADRQMLWELCCQTMVRGVSLLP